MTRGPRLHALDTDRASGDWTCSCGAAGTDPAAAQAHRAAAARAAFTRLDDHRAWATLSITSASLARLEHWAVRVLYSSRLWYGTATLRRYMRPSYDQYGCLSAQLDWPRLAGDVAVGGFPDDEALLLLKVALSLLGHCPINLVDLEKIGYSDPVDRRNVREILDLLLRDDT